MKAIAVTVLDGSRGKVEEFRTDDLFSDGGIGDGAGGVVAFGEDGYGRQRHSREVPLAETVWFGEEAPELAKSAADGAERPVRESGSVPRHGEGSLVERAALVEGKCELVALQEPVLIVG